MHVVFFDAIASLDWRYESKRLRIKQLICIRAGFVNLVLVLFDFEELLIAQWDCSVGFFKSYIFECKSGRNSIKVAEKWT